jgi:Transposase DDE domain
METALKDKDVQGLKYFLRLLPLLERLKDVGCERDTAGNRKLFFNDYVKLVLLYMWNPLIGSMRGLQKAVALPRVFKALGVRRFSAGSFSEAPAVFEPELLKGVIEELAGELRPLGVDPRLRDVRRALTLVDGTVLSGLAALARAAADTCYNTARDGRKLHGWRLHMQLDLATFSPARTDLTGARNAGPQREHNVLKASLEAGRCYVGDCGYSDRALLNAIVTAQSSYVMRVGENTVFEVLEERELSQEALDAGVVRDAVVRLGGPDAPAMNHPVRLVELQVRPHPRRTRKARKGVLKGSRHSDRLLIVTDMVGLGTELVGLVYRQRYGVELFFRFFKQILGLRHLISQRQEGVEIQVYCAVIACLLIQLQTGRKPDKRTAEMMGWFFLGLASEQDVIDHLNRPDNKGVKLKVKEALWKKLGY